MRRTAHGTFDVKMTSQPRDEAFGDASIGRMAIDKQLAGDLEATSKGEMLASRSPVDGSAGYVALERVTGALHGKRGAFTLQHTGSMNRGAQQLVITVVADSGTDELTGLTGSFTIQRDGGIHRYVFDYDL